MRPDLPSGRSHEGEGRRGARRRFRPASPAARAIVAGAAFAWIFTVGLAEVASAPAVAIGQRLLQDSTFTREELSAAATSVESLETSNAAWARAVIALHLLEIEPIPQAAEAEAGRLPDPAAIDVRRRTAEAAVRQALRLSPSSGYFWYALFALNLPAEGAPAPATLPFLAKSYELAPREGWVSLRRSPTLVPLRAVLPEAFRLRIEAEFRTLLKQNILPVIQKVFVISDPALRLEVLRHMETLPAFERMRFLRGLARELDAGSEG
ncbi:hypothetical protein [Methylobacterium sp. ID0610]|uniref:hypothetical protein n=1 Tax=Methylobacterium carpenticola TaxID=3344827 RepID=UPI003694B81B